MGVGLRRYAAYPTYENLRSVLPSMHVSLHAIILPESFDSIYLNEIRCDLSVAYPLSARRSPHEQNDA
jgi:hypothetical protein